MVDIVNSATRSLIMSRILGRNTKPEILIRQQLHHRGFRFRLHVSNLPGKPDIVLPRYRAVIFVNGCFWHGHNCPLFKLPGTRTDFWREKIERNQLNDNRAKLALYASGWRVGVVWECALRGAGKNIPGVGQNLDEWLRRDTPSIELRGFAI